MKKPSSLIWIFACVLSFSGSVFGTDSSFIAVDVATNQVKVEEGSSLDQRVTPGCSFNIVLSLIGYDRDILFDEAEPVWPYDGSKVPFDSHKAAQSPKSWMSVSVLWYSKRLAQTIGRETLRRYVSLFSYGNQDVSGEVGEINGFTMAHECSTLAISPREQVDFVKRFVLDKLPVSSRAIERTKTLLFNRTFGSGWTLFGKTGTCVYEDSKATIAWYVGWIERGNERHVFALLVQGKETFPTREERLRLVQDYFRKCHIELE